MYWWWWKIKWTELNWTVLYFSNRWLKKKIKKCRKSNKVVDEASQKRDRFYFLTKEHQKPPAGNFTLGEYTEKVIMYGFLMVRCVCDIIRFYPTFHHDHHEFSVTKLDSRSLQEPVWEPRLWFCAEFGTLREWGNHDRQRAGAWSSWVAGSLLILGQHDYYCQ